MSMSWVKRGLCNMVSSISSSTSLIDAYSVYGSSKSSEESSFSSAINNLEESTSETSSVSESSDENSEEEVSAAELADGLTGISTCPHCGAIYMGCSPSVCAKCGQSIEASQEEGKSSTGGIEESGMSDLANSVSFNKVDSSTISTEIMPTTIAL